METPTARVMEEGRFRFGIGLIDPYYHYYGAITPLKGLEIGFRVTEILGTEGGSGPIWEGYGNHKTKVLDAKYQFLPEGKYLPAFALGIMDPHGTRQYASQYLVLSKQIYPFDLTLGFGNGRYGDKPLLAQGEGFALEMFEDPKQWLKDGRFFWGVEYAATDNLRFMVEYNPILYSRQTSDPAYDKYFRNGVPSEYNFGVRYNLWNWFELGLSYQRGETLGFHVSMPFEIGRPIIPIYNRPYREPPLLRFSPIDSRIINALVATGFSDIGLETVGGRLSIDLQNNKYFYIPNALDTVLVTIAPIVAHADVKEILVIFKSNGIPMSSVLLTMQELAAYEQYRNTPYGTYVDPLLSTGYTRIPANRKLPRQSRIALGIKPQFNFFLNDPSGFLKGNIGISAWGSYRTWTGASVVAGVAVYPFTNISTVNSPLSIPVRTDVVEYIENKVLLERLVFNQIYRIAGSNIFTGLSIGLLELQYAGLDVEIASSFINGRLLLGLSSSVVKKRDPDGPLRMKAAPVKDYFTTALLNTRVNFPGPDISVDVKYGRFLAGDVGARVTATKFIRAVKISAWYSFTDTSVFTDAFNRDYHDKGISVTIPVRVFKGTDSRTTYTHSISAWTRDVAQDIGHFRTLFDFIGRNAGVLLRKDRGAR